MPVLEWILRNKKTRTRCYQVGIRLGEEHYRLNPRTVQQPPLPTKRPGLPAGITNKIIAFLKKSKKEKK